MAGFTDIHSHFVYGMDDGARTVKDMEAMLDAAYQEGLVALFATPHVTPGVQRFHEDRYQRHLEKAREYCQQKGYPISIYEGAELLYTPVMLQYLTERTVPTLAGTDTILMEFTPDISYADMEEAVSVAIRSGYQPILAHIERYKCLTRGRAAWRLKEKHPVRYQVNAGSLLESPGFWLGRIIDKWFKEQLIDLVASDAHDLERRPFRTRAAHALLTRKYGEEYANDLMGLE